MPKCCDSDDLKTFETHARKLTRAFVKRGYPRHVVVKSMNRAMKVNREQLLQPRREKKRSPENAVTEQNNTSEKTDIGNAFKLIKQFHKQIDIPLARESLNTIDARIKQLEATTTTTGTTGPTQKKHRSAMVFSNRRTIGSFFTKNFKNGPGTAQ